MRAFFERAFSGRPKAAVRSIEEFHSDPRTRTFAQFLVDLEESPHARAVVLDELRERELRQRS